MDEISVWNNNQQWTPVSIEGNVLVFNVQSNGEFYVYDNGRKILFSFVNDMQQDFTIYSVNAYSNANPSRPGTELTKFSYQQDLSRAKDFSTIFWVKSTNVDIRDLTLRGVNCYVTRATPIASDVGNEWSAIYTRLEYAQTSMPVEIYLGDVLVYYIARVVD